MTDVDNHSRNRGDGANDAANRVTDAAQVRALTQSWLQDVVIGLGLCPFAARPAAAGTIAINIAYPSDEEALREYLCEQMALLDSTPAAVCETTLVVIPTLLNDFTDYHLFMRWTDQLLKRNGWQGVYQLASFHPDYVFAGAQQEDVENFTNRAPFPIIHIIREESLARALQYYPDVESVPERNQAVMRQLPAKEIARLFYYLHSR